MVLVVEFQNLENSSNLSQLEIDRLAFLHQSMKDRGEKVPTLSQIAADIQGTKPLALKGIATNMETVQPQDLMGGYPIVLAQVAGLRNFLSKSAQAQY